MKNQSILRQLITWFQSLIGIKASSIEFFESDSVVVQSDFVSENETLIQKLEEEAPQKQMEAKVSDLLHKLRFGKTTIQCAAAIELADLNTEYERVIPGLAILTVNSKSIVRKTAIESLEKLDTDWKSSPYISEILPELVRKLNNIDDNVVRLSSNLLFSIGQSSIQYLNPLLDNHDNTAGQLEAVKIIGKIGAPAVEAVPVLLKTLKDSNKTSVQKAIIKSLSKIGEVPETAIPFLVNVLVDSDHELRQLTVKLLGSFNDHNETTIRALVLLLADKNNHVRKATIETLINIGPSSIPCLIDLLKGREKARLEGIASFREGLMVRMKGIVNSQAYRTWRDLRNNLSWYLSDAQEDFKYLELAYSGVMKVLVNFSSFTNEEIIVISSAINDPNPDVRRGAAAIINKNAV